MTEWPFVHKKAFSDVKNNFIFHEKVAEILFKTLNYRGILNIGGKKQSIYNFAKKYNKKVIPISRKNNSCFKSFPDLSMNLEKMKKILN